MFFSKSESIENCFHPTVFLILVQFLILEILLVLGVVFELRKTRSKTIRKNQNTCKKKIKFLVAFKMCSKIFLF